MWKILVHILMGCCFKWQMLITTEADVIACFVCLLLADAIANVTVTDVIATYNTEADVIAFCVTLLLTDVIVNLCGGYYVHIL